MPPLTGYRCIADVPVEFDAPADDGSPLRSRIQVAELGTFTDPRYGRIAITADKVANWQLLLASHFHGRVPIDFDHNTDKNGPTGSKAGAWIVGLDNQGEDGETSTPTEVWATVEWTKSGEDAVRGREYLYISPTFVDQLADKKGKKLGPALLRAALTNNPFLNDMPAISLSGATLASRDESGNRGVPDSRPAMALTDLAKALGLPEDADEAKILEATVAAKTAADEAAEKPEPETAKTLEAQATEQGKVLLDATALATLTAQAAAGAQAATDLAAQRFTTCFDKALSEGRVDAKPETRELHQKIFDANPDLAIENLDALPKVVNLTRSGKQSTSAEPGDAPDGYDQDRYELHTKATAYALEHKVDYMTALDAVQDEVLV